MNIAQRFFASIAFYVFPAATAVPLRIETAALRRRNWDLTEKRENKMRERGDAAAAPKCNKISRGGEAIITNEPTTATQPTPRNDRRCRSRSLSRRSGNEQRKSIKNRRGENAEDDDGGEDDRRDLRRTLQTLALARSLMIHEHSTGCLMVYYYTLVRDIRKNMPA